ncbi:MAG: hypothetical protein K9G63_19315 [Melioribacteraceae bacterium]|nr:hypothetical protein [Melioribacteraceae bacterium]
MINSRLLKLSVIVFVLIGSSTSAQSESDLYSTENRRLFGDYLFCQQDYLRAIREYQEYLKFESNDTVRFKIAYGFNRMGRYIESADNFKSLFFASALAEEAKLEFLTSLYFGGRKNEFFDQLARKTYLPKKYEPHLVRLSYLSEFEKSFSYSLPDSAIFVSLFNDSAKVKMAEFYSRKKHPGYKNPTTAALLSAALPGLGKIYTEEYSDGITAFLLTGLMTFLAVDNFKADHDLRAWLFTGLAAYFYAGNIYGSAASAQIYNAGIRFNFENDFSFYLNQNNYFLPQYDFLCR